MRESDPNHELHVDSPSFGRSGNSSFSLRIRQPASCSGTGLSSSESDSSGAGGGDDDLESEQEGSDFKRQRRFEPTSVVLPLPSPVGTHSTN